MPLSLPLLNLHLSQILEIVSKERKQVFLLGDFNINLLNYNDHQPTNDFLDSLVSTLLFHIFYIQLELLVIQ